MEFTELGTTKEYKETQYFEIYGNRGGGGGYGRGAASYRSFYGPNEFLADYLDHLVSQDAAAQEGAQPTPFLTKRVFDVMFRWFPFVCSVIDLPVVCNSSKLHSFKTHQSEGLEITLQSNAIVYKSELKKG